MVTEEHPQRRREPWGPRPGEDWRAHRLRVFADYPDLVAVLRVAESREHEVEIWREWQIAKAAGDPEMQQLAREARYDLEAPPEEDEDDLRYVRSRRDQETQERSMQEFLRWLHNRFPEQVDGHTIGV